MSISHLPVSIGLPIRNGAAVVDTAIRAVLTQDHGDLELVISDNASTDSTEEICRSYARDDPRVRYYRQPNNIGATANFVQVMRLARGAFFRWIGDDDWLDPGYLSQCLERFAADDRLILVTTEQILIGKDGQMCPTAYTGCALSSDRPVERFAAYLHLLAGNQLVLDPLYGLMRREAVMAIPRRNIVREDEIFAAKLALAGPWGHVPVVLARRGWKIERLTRLARRLDVPFWQVWAANLVQCRELLSWLQHAPLTHAERREARAEVRRFYRRRHQRTAVRRYRKLMGSFRFDPVRSTMAR
jgi:glycosyltransferase involved in cell wall biosynthesis